jgi:hypothetical protein
MAWPWRRGCRIGTQRFARIGAAAVPYRANNSTLLTSFKSQPLKAATAASASAKRKTSIAQSLRRSEKAYITGGTIAG